MTKNKHISGSLYQLLAVLILSCLLPGAATGKGHEDGDDVLLKVAYVYNFAKFSRWPADALGRENAPLYLCVAGEDILGNELEKLNGRAVGQHSIKVLSYKAAQEEVCHLLYVASSEVDSYALLMRPFKGKPVLSISEIAGFSRGGGIIELFPEEGRLRFAINLTVARECGLELSARMLSLAEIIE